MIHMRFMAKIVLMLMTVLCTAGYAQENEIGVFLEANPTWPCNLPDHQFECCPNICGASQGEVFDLYVVVINGTTPCAGVEFSYRIETNNASAVLRTSETRLMSGACITVTPGTTALLGEYTIGCAQAVPAGSSVPIVRWQFVLTQPDVWMKFYLGPSSIPSTPDRKPVMYDGLGHLIPLTVYGGGSGPAALVNLMQGVCMSRPSCDQPVSDSATSFGALKAIYR